MKSESVYINRMLDSAGKIQAFTAGYTKEKFFADRKTQSAVIMQLMLIGENSKKLSGKTKKIINLPWVDIAAFRNIATHEYLALKLSIVWDTVINDIPRLVQELEKSLPHVS